MNPDEFWNCSVNSTNFRKDSAPKSYILKHLAKAELTGKATPLSKENFRKVRSVGKIIKRKSHRWLEHNKSIETLKAFHIYL